MAVPIIWGLLSLSILIGELLTPDGWAQPDRARDGVGHHGALAAGRLWRAQLATLRRKPAS